MLSTARRNALRASFSEALLLPILAGAIYATLRLVRSPSLRYALLAGSAWGLAVLDKAKRAVPGTGCVRIGYG